MADSRLQFSLRRLLILMLAWAFGLAAMSQLPGGPYSIGCVLMYGVFASVIFLASERRLLIVWCVSWIFLTISAAILMTLLLNSEIPTVAGYVFLPAQRMSSEQELISSGCQGWGDAMWVWPLLTGIALSPAMAVLIEVVHWVGKRWKSKPPLV